MIKKIGQAVAFGLFCAGLILYVAPWLNKNIVQQTSAPQIVSYSDAVKIASPAVVNIYTQSYDPDANDHIKLNTGSGVIMSKNGYILTNQHVIQDSDGDIAPHIIVALQSGLLIESTVVGTDRLTDLAVLKIAADNLPTIPQNPHRVSQVGDVVLAIGNPYNLGQSVTQGIISATGRNTISERVRQNFIQIDASINKGNSGGALINTAGELIGINTVSLKNSGEIAELSISGNEAIAEGLNFAIPINLASQVLQKIIQDGRVIRGFFGVNSDLINTAQRLGLGDKGVIVTGLAENGPAQRAGILEGDLILKIGNVEALSPQQMMEEIANIPPNTRVNVLVNRRGNLLEFEVTIAEFPDSIK